MLVLHQAAGCCLQHCTSTTKELQTSELPSQQQGWSPFAQGWPSFQNPILLYSIHGSIAVINILLIAGIIALLHSVFSLPPCINWLLGTLQSFKENALKNKTEKTHVKLGNEHALLATPRN